MTATKKPDILSFAKLWRLDSGKTFAEVMEDWQARFLVEATATVPGPLPGGGSSETGGQTRGPLRPKYSRVLISIPRQSAKTEMLAMVGCFRTITVRGGVTVSIARDQDQALLQRGRLWRAIKRSPMIAREFTERGLKADQIWLRSGEGYWAFVPSDEASSGGHVVATLLCDEVGQFGKGMWGLIAQVSPSPAVVGGQTWFSGFKGPVQNRAKGCPLFDLMAAAEAGDPDLYALVVEGRSPASWHTDKFLEAQRRMLPANVYAQLYENRWVEGEDQFLTLAMVGGAIDHALDRGGVPAPGEIVVLGMDVGLVCDRTVLSAVAIGRGGARLIRQRVWAGSYERPVELGEVQETAAALYRELGARLIVLDPWQAAQMGQGFAAAGLAVEIYRFTGQSVERMAAGLYGLFANGQIRLPDDDELKQELLSLTCRATAGGYKWEHPSGGHDDRVTSLALAASPLFEAAASVPEDGGEEIVYANPAEDWLTVPAWM